MLKKVLLGISMVVLNIHMAHAVNVNNPEIEKQSFEIAAGLNLIAQLNSSDLCAGDIIIAAAYIESAGRELQHDKQLAALTSLTSGQNELKEISAIRTYCTQLAPEVKPFFARTILIKSELENEPPQPPDHTSD
ncbi:MAG: hypothetical protein PSV35_07720 [bacterium]|nr:hypothetical protein [bacterium]